MYRVKWKFLLKGWTLNEANDKTVKLEACQYIFRFMKYCCGFNQVEGHSGVMEHIGRCNSYNLNHNYSIVSSKTFFLEICRKESPQKYLEDTDIQHQFPVHYTAVLSSRQSRAVIPSKELKEFGFQS